ncbi:uncharacterized oxidoreductase YtbE-like [Epargyreus clarus]|uniref:uncharacterized oxidoreductase YtbE-like n=1 Tax=Epargyreus clarus TaxID=520877 RepID=UPI003C2CFD69
MASNQPVMSQKMRLYNGVEMPAVGINTYRVRLDEEVHMFVDNALSAGYRLFDTAAMYGNEVALNRAFEKLLPKYNLKRSDLFITSKIVTRSRASYTGIKRVLEKTLKNLGTDYLDLYLINYPTGNTSSRKRTWAAMQAVYEDGNISAIGVCNHSKELLRQLASSNSPPMVNQVEWNPLMHDEQLYAYCKRHDMVLQAYSPFGTPFASDKKLFHYPVIRGLASKYDATVAQIPLKWSLQRQVAVLPVSTDPAHMKENINLNFRISTRDMDLIDAIAPDYDQYESRV